jgi:hypothetical protein
MSRRTRRRAPGGAALALSVLSLAACGSSAPAPAAPGAPSISTPLATSVQTPSGTWATVAMGHLEQPLNTFWQLLFRPAAGATWSNHVQATAAATNGGLVLASDGSGLAVGVRPTNLLTFSPLIFTSDAGRSWSTGLLSQGLAASPDALAADSATHLLALASARGQQQVLQSTTGLSGWRTSTSAGTLGATAPGRACGLATLTAVAYAAGTPLAGGGCSRPGVIGVFADRGGGWGLLDAAAPSALAHERIEVLALHGTGSGAAALLGVSDDGSPSLVAARFGAGRWSVSEPLAVSGSEHLSSIAAAGEGGFFALLDGSSPQPQLYLASTAGWRQLPSPPAGTATVALGPASSVEALAVKEAVLSIWTLAARGRAWAHRQTMRVPIEYGSSE